MKYIKPSLNHMKKSPTNGGFYFDINYKRKIQKYAMNWLELKIFLK